MLYYAGSIISDIWTKAIGRNTIKIISYLKHFYTAADMLGFWTGVGSSADTEPGPETFLIF